MNKSKTQIKEVVQHQGWLLKRGEGYEGEETTTNIVPGTSPPKNDAAVHKSQKLLKQQDIDADFVLNSLQALLLGKGEKRRFFRLITLEERFVGAPHNSSSNDRTTHSMSRGGRPSDLFDHRAELRYYSKELADAASLKGVIKLTADCELKTKSDDANLILVTPGRSYYLRPEGDVTAMATRTIAFQWSDAIRREIRAIWALQQINIRSQLPLSSTPQQLLFKSGSRARLLRGESIMASEPEQVPSTLTEVLANPETRNDFREFLENALASESLEFYEAVENLSKSADPKSKIDEIINTFVVPGSPREVNLSSSQRNQVLKTKDFTDAKQEVFKLMEDNFFKRFYRETMDKTGAFAALYATLGIDGFNAVLQHFGPVKTDLGRTLLTYKARLKRAENTIELMKKELSSSSREIAVMGQSSTERALVAAYHSTVVRLEALVEYTEEMRNQVVNPLEQLSMKIEHDLHTIHKSVETQILDLEECKKLIFSAQTDIERARQNGVQNFDALKDNLTKCEIALENMETLNSKPIEQAMAKLESLELYRIQTQKEIVRYAAIAEKNMVEAMAKGTGLLSEAVKRIDIDRDIRELTHFMEEEMESLS